MNLQPVIVHHEEDAQDVAQCNIEINSTHPYVVQEFTAWVIDNGGPDRLAKIHDVNRSTIWRFCNNKGKGIPKLWINLMRVSMEMAELRNENARLRRRL